MSAKSDFFDALAEGDFSKAKDLKERHGFGPTTRDWTRSQMSPLAYAVRLNNPEFAAEMIAEGANVNEMVGGDTPLIMMAQAEMVELLAANGADLDARLKRDAGNVALNKGATALIKAALNNNGPLVEKLLELGANVNAKDRFDRTALHYATADSDVPDRLIHAGADFMAKDKYGRSPLFASERTGTEPAVATVENSITPVAAIPSAPEAVPAIDVATDTAIARNGAKPRAEPKSIAAIPQNPETLLPKLEGYAFTIGQRLTMAHGDFVYLDRGDDLGSEAIYGVVPKNLAQSVFRLKDRGDLEEYLEAEELDQKDREAVRAFFDLSAHRELEQHEQIAAPPQNAIIGIQRSVPPEAIDLNEYIERLETGKAAAGVSAEVVEGGPQTLLRGRFIRDDAGQYRRIGEERVSLVDEGDKIRFVDKQFDTFQAATELASAKQWQAIQVSGTEKFRAEAWFAAKLAGLDVVGYEPSEKDITRLEQAVRRGLEQNPADRAPDLAASRKEAEDLALAAGRGLQGVSENGTYKGKVLHETAHHVVQDIGRNVAVLHEKAGLDVDQLGSARKDDKSIRVQYSKGRPSVVPEREQTREAALTR